MSRIKRRQFLQFTGSTLATIGLNQFAIAQQGDRYAQVLAQNSPRKLALLVGIDEYKNDTQPLKGCVNDVLLQKELLTYRFGFNPKDIRILTNSQATRQNILNEFEKHLIEQAKPGDVVVFHFSGHGSRVVDPDKDNKDGLNSTLVPVDSRLPQGYISKGGTVSDIMGHTLFLLMYALKTDNVTFVLDCCHSGGATRGNFLVRSRPGGEKLQAIPVEFEYQRQWLNRLNLKKSEYIRLRKNVAKGVVLASAQRDQLALDGAFSDFSAGAFTYALTQYLWQKTANESVKKVFFDVSRTTERLARDNQAYQNPVLEANLKESSNPPLYFTPFSTSYADAVVTEIKGNEVQLWLGGVEPQSLDAFDKKNAIFSIINNNGKETGTIQLESRRGLVATGKLTEPSQRNTSLTPGTLLQERLRGIPNDITLKIGLDDSFDRKTTVQAERALNALNRIVPLPLRQQEVQYIFGRMTQERYKQIQKNITKNLPPVGSLGLFLPSLNQIVPNSFAKPNETVDTAVKRLQFKFRSLLAVRIVKHMLGNTNTSRLKVTASMKNITKQEIVSETFTVRGSTTKQPTKSVDIINSVSKLPVDTQIAFQVENQESTPLYLSILAIDSTGDMVVIFPDNQLVSEKNGVLLSPGEKRTIPDNNKKDNMTLSISEPLGITEALIITSTSPLHESLKALQRTAMKQDSTTRGAFPASDDDFLDIAEKLLSDLDTATRSGTNAKGIQLPPGVRGVDTTKLAAMSIAIEVVEK